MAKEVTIARENSVSPINAGGRAIRDNQRRTDREDFRNEKRELEASQERMPTTNEKEDVPNLVTGKLSRPGMSKAHFLYRLYDMGEVLAAERAWNHPEELQWQRESPLGEVYDLSDPIQLAKKERKERAGVINYQVYKLTYNGRDYLVKTENIGGKYEKLHHLEKVR